MLWCKKILNGKIQNGPCTLDPMCKSIYASDMQSWYSCVEKENFIRFLINFYNAHSLENRDIVPLKVNIVLEKNYVINTAAVKDFVIRKVIIDEKSREILEVWQYDRFKDEKGRIKSMEKYMKFEYINGGQRSWLHINKSSGWY